MVTARLQTPSNFRSTDRKSSESRHEAAQNPYSEVPFSQSQWPRCRHPRGLRHTRAAELRAEGIDIGIISKQLGHTSNATTARYLDHIAPLAVIAVLRQRTW